MDENAVDDLDDYLSELREARFRGLKESFLDYIIALENQLELAEQYASAGDVRVLRIAQSLEGIENEVAEKAQDANEPIPPEDYSTHMQHIIDAFKTKYPDVYAQATTKTRN
ncbi:MAG: hypothetical protein WCO65_03360 [bacterium]